MLWYFRTFEEAGLTPVLLKNVRQCGYTKPTPIQQYAIPYIARGKDVIACAQTGSGKTVRMLTWRAVDSFKFI